MNIIKYLKNYIIIKKLQQYRKLNKINPHENREMCENFYHVDDINNDGRGED